jgi:hypothetical protein
MTIKEILYELIKPWLRPEIFTGTVVKIDWDKRECDVKLDSGVTIFGCNLRSAIDGNKQGVCFKPKMKSIVTVATLFGLEMNGTIIQFSEIDEVEISTSKFSFTVDASGVAEYNKGLNGGMIKVTPLKAELTRLQAELSFLKPMVAYAVSFASATLDGGSTAGVYTTGVGLLPPQNLELLENKKIKH